MYPNDPQDEWGEAAPDQDADPGVIDFETDPVTALDETTLEEGADELAALDQPAPMEPLSTPDNALLDDVLVGFVDLFNAKDFEALGEMLSPDASSQFFEGVTGNEIREGMFDFSLRFPTLVLTRGDLGSEPIAPAWLLDQEDDSYELVGYFRVEIDDSDEPSIVSVDYVEEVPDTEEVVLEPPEGSERNEWEDWSITDSGE